MRYLLFIAEWSKASLETRDLFKNFMSDVPLTVIPLETQPSSHEEYAIRRLPTLVRLVDEREDGRSVAVDLVELFNFVKEKSDE